MIESFDLQNSLTLIILYIVPCFGWFGSVGSHHIVIHDCRSSEQRKAARRTEYATQHVFSSFLKPVTNGIFEFLVPYHWTYLEKKITFFAQMFSILVFGGLGVVKWVSRFEVIAWYPFRLENWKMSQVSKRNVNHDYWNVLPVPIGWMRPQAAPTFLFFLILSTSNVTDSALKSISPSKVNK